MRVPALPSYLSSSNQRLGLRRAVLAVRPVDCRDFMRGFPAVCVALVVFFRGRLAARFFRFGATLRASVSGTSAFLASLTLAAIEPSVEPIDSATDTRSSLPFDPLLDDSSDIAPPYAPLSEISPNCINNSCAQPGRRAAFAVRSPQRHLEVQVISGRIPGVPGIRRRVENCAEHGKPQRR